MGTIQRDVARFGALTVMWSRASDDTTEALQLGDVIVTPDGAGYATIGGSIDAHSVAGHADTGSGATFTWESRELTAWFLLLAPGLEVRADEARLADVSLTITQSMTDANTISLVFTWEPAETTSALVELSYAGTSISRIPSRKPRSIRLAEGRGTIVSEVGASALNVRSALSWQSASGWRELYPAAAPVVLSSATPLRPEGSSPVDLVGFDPLGLAAPEYLPGQHPSAVDVGAGSSSPRKVPILDSPANDQTMSWGGRSGAFEVAITSDGPAAQGGLELDLVTDLSVDPVHFTIDVDPSIGIPLGSSAGGDRLEFTYRGFLCVVEGHGGAPLVLRTLYGDHAVTLAGSASATLLYDGLGDRPLQFEVTAFSITQGGIAIDAHVLDEPTTLNGIATGFRFTDGVVQIREGEVADFTLSGSGPMPPDLVGDASASIAVHFAQREVNNATRAIPVGSAATLVTEGSLMGVAVPFRYDLDSVGLGFAANANHDRYDFYFTLTGAAAFSPGDGFPDDHPLAMLDVATIELDEAPLAGDLTELLKSMSFSIELAEPVTFQFLRCFTMEISEVALYGQAEVFDGQPGVELAGQVKFADGEGDKARTAATRHRLVIGPPKDGEVVPRIHLKELGITIEKGEAFKLDAVVNFVEEVDDAGVATKGFTGEGTIEIQGLPSLAVAVGFMTVQRPADPPHPAETLRAWFISINVGNLTLQVPYISVFLREVGLGFGYRYTLTAIAAADEAQGLAATIAALREASRTAGDLATVDAWQIALEPRGADPRWTIAMRALFTQNASPSSTPLRLDTKAETKLANVFLFDVLAAVRSDLTIFMAARVWLNTNYIDYVEDADGTIRGNPLFSGFAIVQPAHQRFLAQVSSNPDGHKGSHPPLPDFMAQALSAVQVSATVLIEPNLVHAELGWPNGLRYGMKVGGIVDLAAEAGVIYRIAQLETGGQSLVLGISYKARASLEFRKSVNIGFAGASIVATASASFGARFIAAAQLATGSDRLDVYGGLSVDLRIKVAIRAWIGIDLGLIEIKKHFSLSLELGFSASLEFGLLVNANGTSIGFQGRGTLMVRAFGRRLEFRIAVEHRGDIVLAARKATAKYMAIGLEAGDGPVALGDLDTAPAESTAGTTDAATAPATEDTAADSEVVTPSRPTPTPTLPPLDAGRPGGGALLGSGDEPVASSPTTPAPTEESPAPSGSVVAASWMALAIRPSEDHDDPSRPSTDDTPGWTHVVVYPGDGPGFTPVPPGPSRAADAKDFAVDIDATSFEEVEWWNTANGAFESVSGRHQWAAQWSTQLANYLADAFVHDRPSDPEHRPVPPSILSDPPVLADTGPDLRDGRVRHPSESDYEAAVRGTLEQFRRSPHFKADPQSTYEQHLRAAFSPDTDIYESPAVERARQLRSMAVEQMIGDVRDWVDDATAIDPAKSPVFLLGLVFRAKGGAWLDGTADAVAPRLSQRIGPSGDPVEPDGPIRLFNTPMTSFSASPPEFENACQFADASMIAFDWDLTWDAEDDIEHHLAHYEVRRRAQLDSNDQVTVTTFKPADALAHVGDGVIRLVRRRFEFVDNFDDETLDQIAALPAAGRTYVYTITPVDVTGGRGRPITLVATRVPSTPPLAPTDPELVVEYGLTAGDFQPVAADPPPPPITPRSISIEWAEPAPPADRPLVAIKGRELVFRRRSTLPVGSFGLDTATNSASTGDLPSSNARVRRDDLVMTLDDVAAGDGRRRTATIELASLRQLGVFPRAGWQPDAWQVFVRTVSDTKIPSALVPVKLVLRFAPATVSSAGSNAIEDRQPAELEWITPPVTVPPLPTEDTVASAGALHVPTAGTDGVEYERAHGETRLVRLRWNQVPSGSDSYDPGLNAGYHVFRLDVDAHTAETFGNPDRIAAASRLVDEVRLQRPDTAALEPSGTGNPGLWEAWATQVTPGGNDLGWPGAPIDALDGVEALLHPTLQKLVAELGEAPEVVVGVEQGRPFVDRADDKVVDGFMTTFGPGADPFGWSLLQFLGLSVTISLRNRRTNQRLAGAEVDRRIRTVLASWRPHGDDPGYPRLATSVERHLQIDRLYQQQASSAVVRGVVPDDAMLAMVQMSLRPLELEAEHTEEIATTFGPQAGPDYVTLQALVDRATAAPGQVVVPPGLPSRFTTRLLRGPSGAGGLGTVATAAPRASAPTRAIPDAQGRVRFDDVISDGYAHAFRYYVRPYSRYQRVWTGLAESAAFRSIAGDPARLRIDRPIDVSTDDGSVGGFGADAALDRVAAITPPVILSSRRVDPAPANPASEPPPGSTWEIVLATHREQILSEQNRTVARRLDYRQIMSTVLRTFRYWACATAVDWPRDHVELSAPTELVPALMPTSATSIVPAALSPTSQERADLDVVSRVGEAAKQAEIIQIQALPFYYEHRFVAVAQTSMVVSATTEIRHREFGYRAPDAIGSVTAEPAGDGRPVRTVTVAFARLWDSLTEESQRRWPGEDPSLAPAGKRLVSAIPDPEVAYELLFRRAGTIQPIALIVHQPPTDDSKFPSGGEWRVETVSRAFRIERQGRFVRPHGDRDVGIAMALTYVGEPFDADDGEADTTPAPEVPVARRPDVLPSSVDDREGPWVLATFVPFTPLSDAEQSGRSPTVLAAYDSIAALVDGAVLPDGELVSTPLDPTRPDPDIPRMRADLDDANRHFVALRIDGGVSSDERAALGESAGGPGWGEAVAGLLDAVDADRTVPLLPSLADTMPASITYQNNDVVWAPLQELPGAFDDLEIWVSGLETAGRRFEQRLATEVDRANGLGIDTAPLEQLAASMRRANEEMHAHIDRLSQAETVEGGIEVPVIESDPELAPWYRRRPAELLGGRIAVGRDELTLHGVTDIDAAQISDAAADVDPALALSLERLGGVLSSEYALPQPLSVLPRDDDYVTTARLRALDVFTTQDRDELIEQMRADPSGEAATRALYARALWFDLAGGELLLRTRRGTAPPSPPPDELMAVPAADPTPPIPASHEEAPDVG